MKDNKELLSIIAAHDRSSIGVDTQEFSIDRADALDRYFGRPYGNEQEGRSKVVSKDISDAVDWILPSLIRIFLSTHDAVRFDPVGPEDEEQAEQESDYVNHVIMKENDGFCIVHDWIKDALLLRNGYVKRWWDETEEITHETYTNLSEVDIVMLIQELERSGDDIDIVEQETKQLDDGVFYDLKLKRTAKKGQVKILPTPPEEITLSNRAGTDIQESVYVAHTTLKTRSDLIEMGLSKDFVNDLPTWTDQSTDEETLARDTVDDETEYSNSPDRSIDEIEYKECFIRVDADEDGIAELRKVVVTGGKIPDGEDYNQEIDEIPISYWTPNRLPHRHVGLSIYDELKDIAEIKTALIRGTLDNTYQLVNSEWLVNERVNLSDFTQSRPNGVKRVTGKEPILDAATQVVKAPIIGHVIPVLDYVDGMKGRRTGVDQNVIGLDPDTLKKTTEGAARQALSQANQKIEMIARLFAETGFKELASAVHELLIKHQEKSKVVKLRNEWVEINPQEWLTRSDMTVNVGLGRGSQDEVRMNLMLMADVQERAAQSGIVLPKNVYNLANEMSEALGYRQEGLFFTDPESEEFQQMMASREEQPNPLAEVEEVKGQFKMQSDQIKHQHEMHKLDFEKQKFHFEYALKVAHEEIQALKDQVDADLGKPGVGQETQDIAAVYEAELQKMAGFLEEQNRNIWSQFASLLNRDENQQLWEKLMETLNTPQQFERDENDRISGLARREQ